MNLLDKAISDVKLRKSKKKQTDNQESSDNQTTSNNQVTLDNQTISNTTILTEGERLSRDAQYISDYTVETPIHLDENAYNVINTYRGSYQNVAIQLDGGKDENGNSYIYKTVYQGSARGYEMSGITNFKDICDETGCVNWTAGHQNAFGISIDEDRIEEFLEKTDIALVNMASEPVYYVDYIYNGADVNPQDILEISNLSDLWGKDMDEAMVAVKDIKISKELVVVYRKTSNTLKITLPNKVSLMKFNATDEECEMLENQTGAYIQMDIVGKCHKNEWLGNITPQIFIEDWEITGQGKYLF